jgi:NDP-sugar pyrophosphorylase family protein
LERLAQDGQLTAYKHQGFWQCMDTVRDKVRLEDLWDSGNPPLKIWENDADPSSHAPMNSPNTLKADAAETHMPAEARDLRAMR